MTSIAVAGATGNLGRKIVKALCVRGAEVRALVRPGTTAEKIASLEQLGAQIVEVDLGDRTALARALAGTACVVSALQGLREVIVGTQSVLLDAAVKAGVPRFIPSDYSTDFTQMPQGTNRNFDLRLEFHRRLALAPIRATSIFNGAFMDMLAWGMGLLDTRGHRVTHWGDDPNALLQFTTMDDTAAYTAEAALDENAPRFVRIAGDLLGPRQLAAVAEAATGEKFSVVSLGSLQALEKEIETQRAADPAPESSPFPKWVQLQYALGMINGLAVVKPLDNDRYAGIRLTRVQDFLSKVGARA